jgi:hypothetical protein
VGVYDVEALAQVRGLCLKRREIRGWEVVVLEGEVDQGNVFGSYSFGLFVVGVDGNDFVFFVLLVQHLVEHDLVQRNRGCDVRDPYFTFFFREGASIPAALCTFSSKR